MPDVPTISEAEWKIMKLLWTRSPQPAYDLVEVLARTEEWHPNTIKTMLSRLVKKKALGVTKYKNLHLYRPLISEEECIQVESDWLLNRVFGGAVKPLLLHFVRKQKLTAADLDELKTILKKKEK